MLDPEERYRDAQELLKALEKWRKAEPSSSPKSRSLISSTGKSQLGQAAAPNRKVAETLAGEALALAREGRLSDAADLMEEAFNKLPDLRNRYESRVKLWRCGVSM